MNKLHWGNGGVYLDGWLNMDKSQTYKTDILGDILQSHFDDNRFDVIYSSHAYEHLLFPTDAVEALSRMYRWLKPNGILRLAVPDLELAVMAYTTTGDLSFLYGKDFKGYYHNDTKGERLNYFIRSWEHQFTYDFETLNRMFVDAGFKNIQKKQANESLIENFTHDRFISESLYIEAQKL